MRQIWTLLFLLIFLPLFSQENAKKSIYFEPRIGGINGTWLSATFNFELEVYQSNENWSHTLHAGAGGWSTWGAGGREYIVTANHIRGKGRHHLELQTGYAFLIDDTERRRYYGIPVVNAGYRFEKPEGGFLFKAMGGTWGFLNLSLGYSF